MDEAIRGVIAAAVFLVVFGSIITLMISLLCQRRNQINRRDLLLSRGFSQGEASGPSSKFSSFRDNGDPVDQNIRGYRPKIIGDRNEEQPGMTEIAKRGVSVININQNGTSASGNGHIVRGYDPSATLDESNKGKYVYGYHVNQHGPDEVKQGWIVVKTPHSESVTQKATPQPVAVSASAGNVQRVIKTNQVIKQQVEVGRSGQLEVTGQTNVGNLVQGQKVAEKIHHDGPETVHGHYSKTIEVNDPPAKKNTSQLVTGRIENQFGSATVVTGQVITASGDKLTRGQKGVKDDVQFGPSGQLRINGESVNVGEVVKGHHVTSEVDNAPVIVQGHPSSSIQGSNVQVESFGRSGAQGFGAVVLNAVTDDRGLSNTSAFASAADVGVVSTSSGFGQVSSIQEGVNFISSKGNYSGLSF